MTQATGTEANYAISVKDSEDNVIIAGEGPVLVLYYLAEKAQAMLDELGNNVDATVYIGHGEDRILGATIDAESAASLIKGRVLKLRRSLASTEPAETVVG